MPTKRKRDAHFEHKERSSVLRGVKVHWHIACSATGFTARNNGRTVSLTWREAIGLALFYGRDSKRKETT